VVVTNNLTASAFSPSYNTSILTTVVDYAGSHWSSVTTGGTMYSALPTSAAPGSVIMCPNCQQASTCASGGNGTLARWVGQGSILFLTCQTPLLSPVTVSSCGTAPAVIGNAQAGFILPGSGVFTSCTLNFTYALDAAPYCVAASQNSNAAYVYTTSTSSVQFNFTTAPSGISYHCSN
jgi:hypothetical protein